MTPPPFNRKNRHRPGQFMVSRKDRLGALALGLLVLAYAVISMPRGAIPVYLARIDSMNKKDINNYKTNTKKPFPVPVSNEPQPYSTSRYPAYKPRKNTLSPPERRASDNPAPQKNYAGRYTPLSLNSSDSASLERLPGIGPVLAARIVRYREKLGGFYNSAQLKEVYGIDDTLYSFVGPFLETTAARSTLTKIDLNNATLETLRQHPYLRWEKARAIIRYREANGPFTSVSDLEKIYLLDTATIRRLTPYVQVNAATNAATNAAQ